MPAVRDEVEGVEPVDVLDSAQAGSASIRGGAIRVVGYGGGLLLSAISVPLMIRHLGLIAFGRYTAALAVVALTAGITEFGLRDAATREYATARGQSRNDHMASTIGVRLVVSAIGVIVAVAFAAGAGYGRTIVIGVLVTGIGQLVYALRVVLGVPLGVQLKLTTLTLLDLSQQVILVLLTIAFVVAGLGLGAFFDIQLLAPLPPLILTAWMVRGSTPLLPRFDAGHWRRVLAATVPFTAISIVAVFYFRLSIIFVSLDSTKLQTGYFSASYRVIEALIMIPSLLVASAFPILSRAARDDVGRFNYAVSRLLAVSLIGGAAFALALAIGAPVVTDVLVAKSTGPIVPIIRIHALVLPSAFLIALWGYALLARHRHRAVIGAIGAGLMVNVVLLAVLVPIHGALGAAIAGAVGEATIAVAMTALIVHDTTSVFQLRTPLVVLGASALAVAVGVLTGLPAVPATLAATVVYAVVILASGVFPREVLDAFWKR